MKLRIMTPKIVALAFSTFLAGDPLMAVNAGEMLISNTNPSLAMNAYGGAKHLAPLKLVNNCALNLTDCTWSYRNGMILSDTDPSLAVNAYGGAKHLTDLRLVNNCTPGNSDCTWTFRNGMLFSNSNPGLAVNAYGGAKHLSELKLVNNCTPNVTDCTWGYGRYIGNSITNIDDYFRALPSWSSTNPLSSDVVQPTGAAARDTSTVLPNPNPDSKVESSGLSRYSCTTTPYSLTKTPDKIVTFNPDMGKLWLGSLLQGTGYSGGLGSLAELPIRQRTPLRIFIDLLGPGVVETVSAPDAANVQQGIAALVQRARSSGVPVGTQISYDKHESSTSDETALNFGLSVKYMAYDVKSKFNFESKANETTVAALFVQRAFTVGAVAPQTPSGFFTKAFTPANLQEQISLGRIGPANLPVFVSNIAYGRILMFSLTSTGSAQEIIAVLNASYQAASTGVQIDFDARLKKILAESTIRVATIGGDETSVINMIRTGELNKYFERSSDLSTYKPISYQVDNLGDGSAARFSETSNYNLRECTALPNSREIVGEMARLVVQRIFVPLKSSKQGGSIDNCSQFRVDGRIAADAWGQLLVDGAVWWGKPRSENQKIEVGSGLILAIPHVAAEAIPEGLFPRWDEKNYFDAKNMGGRIFMSSQGGAFRIHGSINDEQGWDGDPMNSFEAQIAYPFNYGDGMVEGNSIHCKINVEYRIEKLSDIYKFIP